MCFRRGILSEAIPQMKFSFQCIPFFSLLPSLQYLTYHLSPSDIVASSQRATLLRRFFARAWMVVIVTYLSQLNIFQLGGWQVQEQGKTRRRTRRGWRRWQRCELPCPKPFTSVVTRFFVCKFYGKVLLTCFTLLREFYLPFSSTFSAAPQLKVALNKPTQFCRTRFDHL